MNLYELKEEYLKALDGITVDEETGEALGLDALDAVSADLDEKLEQTALYWKELNAEADAIKAEMDALASRYKAKRNKADRLKDYAATTMQAVGKERLDTSRVALTWRPSESVEIIDITLIPTEFTRMIIKNEADKAKIKSAIKGGAIVPGAEIVKKQNLQIK